MWIYIKIKKNYIYKNIYDEVKRKKKIQQEKKHKQEINVFNIKNIKSEKRNYILIIKKIVFVVSPNFYNIHTLQHKVSFNDHNQYKKQCFYGKSQNEK